MHQIEDVYQLEPIKQLITILLHFVNKMVFHYSQPKPRVYISQSWLYDDRYHQLLSWIKDDCIVNQMDTKDRMVSLFKGIGNNRISYKELTT